MCVSSSIKRIVYVAVMSVLAMSATAVKADELTPQVWADYYKFFYLNQDWQFYGDTGARYQWDSPRWGRVSVRPSFRFHGKYRNPFEARGGVGFFYNFNEDASNTLEIRPWLGLLIERPRIGPLTISSYIRLEERLVDTIDDGDWSQTPRLRYKAGTKIPLHPTTRKSYWFIPVSFEWFWEKSDQLDTVYNDRLRIDAGIGKIMSYVWTAEVHVVYQGTRKEQFERFSGDYLILRIEVKQLWSAHDYMSQE
jgi:hypothetical protein